MRHWVVAHELYREDLPDIVRLHEVRFEDFLRPHAELARLESFLGLEPASRPSPSVPTRTSST